LYINVGGYYYRHHCRHQIIVLLLVTLLAKAGIIGISVLSFHNPIKYSYRHYT